MQGDREMNTLFSGINGAQTPPPPLEGSGFRHESEITIRYRVQGVGGKPTKRLTIQFVRPQVILQEGSFYRVFQFSIE